MKNTGTHSMGTDERPMSCNQLQRNRHWQLKFNFTSMTHDTLQKLAQGKRSIADNDLAETSVAVPLGQTS